MPKANWVQARDYNYLQMKMDVHTCKNDCILLVCHPFSFFNWRPKFNSHFSHAYTSNHKKCHIRSGEAADLVLPTNIGHTKIASSIKTWFLTKKIKKF